MNAKFAVIFIILLVALVALAIMPAVAQEKPSKKSAAAVDTTTITLNRAALVAKLNVLAKRLADTESQLKKSREWQEYVETLSAVRGIETILNDTTIVVR
jgi:hypothetical protein